MFGQTENMSPGQQFFGCEVSPLLKEMTCGVPWWWLRSSYGVFVSLFNFALIMTLKKTKSNVPIPLRKEFAKGNNRFCMSFQPLLSYAIRDIGFWWQGPAKSTICKPQMVSQIRWHTHRSALIMPSKVELGSCTINRFVYFLLNYLCLCVCVCGSNMGGAQRTIFESWFSPFAMWVPGIRLRQKEPVLAESSQGPPMEF